MIKSLQAISHLVGRDGVAPPESIDNAFIVRPATTYGITTQIKTRYI